MAIEIERKFLIKDDQWRDYATAATTIQQGYFSSTPFMRARVRILGDKGFITLKSQPGTVLRHEFEYEIPLGDAFEIIQRFNIEPIVSKTRYDVMHRENLWVVDVFGGMNAGLVVAEIELNTVGEKLEMPNWVGREVTADPRYGNSNLARNPFMTWSGAV